MEIRKIERGEDDLVLQAAHLFDEPPKPEAVRRFLESETHHIFIAFEGEVPAGFVTGVEMTHPDKGTEMLLYELGVDEQFRRRGTATALVEALKSLSKERGCYGIWVLTDSDNDAALATYRKAGGVDPSKQVMLNWKL